MKIILFIGLMVAGHFSLAQLAAPAGFLNTTVGQKNNDTVAVALASCPAVFNCSTLVLPLTLLDFWGVKGAIANKLYWKTAAAFNTSHFVIQRSGNGNAFDSIGRVNSINTAVDQLYNFTDALPLSGKNYYRLSIVDINAGYRYSNIIVLENELKVNTVFPVPAKQQVTLTCFSAAPALTNFTAFDATGKQVLQVKKYLTAGYNSIAIGIAQLPPGLYWVKIYAENAGSSTVKFSKE